jgi:hypothetical protein
VDQLVRTAEACRVFHDARMDLASAKAELDAAGHEEDVVALAMQAGARRGASR